MTEEITERGRSLAFYFTGRRRYKVYKHPSGFWYADYKDESGKRLRRTLGVRTRPEAAVEVRRLDALGQGGHEPRGASPEPAGGQVSLAEAVERYIDHCTSMKLAPKSIDRYGTALAALKRWAVRNQVAMLDGLTLPLLEGFAKFRAEDEGCAEKTVYNEHLIIKGFLKYAAHPGRRLIAENPASGWSMREPVKVEPYCFTPEEVEKVLSGCREWLRPILATLAYTGMRIGELINLRWQDVDLGKGMIHIRAREDWRPKGRRDRSVPLHPRVKAVLASRSVGEFVFTGPEGGGLKENYLLACFKRDRKALGIGKGTLHTFRHFFISMCAANGVPPTTCMSWVGHRDLDTLLHYYHLHEDESRRAMERLARMGA